MMNGYANTGNSYDFISFTEEPLLDDPVDFTEDSEEVELTEEEIIYLQKFVSYMSESAESDLESSSTYAADAGTDTATDLPADEEQDTTSESVMSYDDEVLLQLKVTNGLMGIQIALQIFFLALFFLVFFMRIIKNNVTNLID